jgi:hypothetical protein
LLYERAVIGFSAALGSKHPVIEKAAARGSRDAQELSFHY